MPKNFVTGTPSCKYSNFGTIPSLCIKFNAICVNIYGVIFCVTPWLVKSNNFAFNNHNYQAEKFQKLNLKKYMISQYPDANNWNENFDIFVETGVVIVNFWHFDDRRVCVGNVEFHIHVGVLARENGMSSSDQFLLRNPRNHWLRRQHFLLFYLTLNKVPKIHL